MSEHIGAESYRNSIEAITSDGQILDIVRKLRLETAIAEDWRLQCALRDAETGDPVFGVDNLSEVCADIAVEYGVDPDFLNGAINLCRSKL